METFSACVLVRCQSRSLLPIRTLIAPLFGAIYTLEDMSLRKQSISIACATLLRYRSPRRSLIVCKSHLWLRAVKMYSLCTLILTYFFLHSLFYHFHDFRTGCVRIPRILSYLKQLIPSAVSLPVCSSVRSLNDLK